jgi:hypothetical protein
MINLMVLCQGRKTVSVMTIANMTTANMSDSKGNHSNTCSDIQIRGKERSRQNENLLAWETRQQT